MIRLVLVLVLVLDRRVIVVVGNFWESGVIEVRYEVRYEVRHWCEEMDSSFDLYPVGLDEGRVSSFDLLSLGQTVVT